VRLALIRADSFNPFHLPAILFDGTPIPLMQEIYADKNKKWMIGFQFFTFHFSFKPQIHQMREKRARHE